PAPPWRRPSREKSSASGAIMTGVFTHPSALSSRETLGGAVASHGEVIELSDAARPAPVRLTATRLTELDLDSLVAVVAPHNTLRMPPRLGTKLAWLSTAPSPREGKCSGYGQSCCGLISLDHSA